MADRNGYIGRHRVIPRLLLRDRHFSPTGITTTFTFASGYTIGYLDVFLNGVKRLRDKIMMPIMVRPLI